MIIGAGIDIVEIERIKRAIKRNDMFLRKLFTVKELNFFRQKSYKSETVAGRFAAKEAVSKAIGTGFRGFSMMDIEILSDELGRPTVTISDKAAKIISEYKNYKFHLSISHSRDNAIAYVVMEGECYDNRKFTSK